MFSKISFFSIIAFLCWTLTSVAATITYIYTGTGSGTVGATPFTNAAFTITAQADTDNIGACSVANCERVLHLSTTVMITSLGTYDITSPLDTFFSYNAPGLARGSDGIDLLNTTTSTISGWDFRSSVGPVNISWRLVQWADSPTISTSGGTFTFLNADPVPGTFQAINAAESIPTLNEWGMIFLASLLALGSIIILKKKTSESC